MPIDNAPHIRFNPLTGERVLVSPHRTRRPWQGQSELPDMEIGPSYDPGCYLCPGNERAGGLRNPDYSSTFVFDNDFAALLPDTPAASAESGPNGLLRARSERGICRVICFSPRHDLTLSRMALEEIAKVVSLWKEQYQELGCNDFINHVQIFENRGSMMGCSNAHPHGQIWAEEFVPDLPARELDKQREYFRRHSTPLLLDYLQYEHQARERIILENEDFTALVPYWAVWPFEVMILPRRPLQSLAGLHPDEQLTLADLIRRLGIRLDNLFQTSFPYSMGLHQLPTDHGEYPGSQFHIHCAPPLLRSASVRKFMVGYELMAQPQRDVTPEMSAAKIREQSEVHYMTGT